MAFLHRTDRKCLEIKMVVDDFFEFTKHDFSYIDEMITNDVCDYKYGLTFNEYLYLWLYTFSKVTVFNEEDKLKVDKIKERYFSNVEYIGTINSFVLCEKCSPIEFEIDNSLLEALKDNMDPNYNVEERIVYYYFKLCMLLKLDTKYNFCHLISRYTSLKLFRKSPNRLEKINCIDNEVSCFEFEAILNKLIRMEGEYAQAKIYSGNSEHVNTDAIINRRVYRFDAFEDPLWSGEDICDLRTVKTNQGYGGVVVNQKDFDMTLIDKIYKDVQEEFSLCNKADKFNSDSLNYCFEIIDGLNIKVEDKDKIKTYFDLFNIYPITGVEYYSHILKKFSTIINDCDDSINLTGVCTNFEDCDLSLILSVKQDDNKMIYFMFGRNDIIDVLGIVEVNNLIEDGKIIVRRKEEYDYDSNKDIDVYKYIPGIDQNLQQRAHKVAMDNVIPSVLKNYYLESLCEKEKTYIKQNVYWNKK